MGSLESVPDQQEHRTNEVTTGGLEFAAMTKATSLAMAAVLAAVLPVGLGAQAGGGSAAVAAHKAAAEKAAGKDFGRLKLSACSERETPPPAPATPAGAPAAARQAPPREQWLAEPAKVFDNFYFIGTREHGAWALTTTAGIIVIDALYDYAVIDAVEAGMKKLGLDPVDMKYLIITHGHGDHHGGTRYLQDKYRPRVVMGARDWDLVARDTRSPRPAKDMEATDGQKITLGDATVTLYITPGHTPTTISPVLTVKDNGVPHVAVQWGGTALNPDDACGVDPGVRQLGGAIPEDRGRRRRGRDLHEPHAVRWDAHQDRRDQEPADRPAAPLRRGPGRRRSLHDRRRGVRAGVARGPVDAQFLNRADAERPMATKSARNRICVAANAGSACVGARVVMSGTFRNSCTISTNMFR